MKTEDMLSQPVALPDGIDYDDYIIGTYVVNYPAIFPMASGGITPTMVPKVMQDLGNDIVIGLGGGIHAHPQGPVAGGKAFRQAIDATMKGVSLEEYAKTHKELAASVKLWADPFKKGL